MNSNEYNRFLKNLFDILQKEDVITKKVSSSKEKINVLNNYFEKLDRVQTKAYEKDELDRIKDLYYSKYVIKESDIPDNYWHFLEQKYLNEGHGHFDLVNPKNYQDEELRKGHVNQIINEQKSSLDSWLNYLLSPDSRYLPMWAKVWAFQGMLKIGTLNEKRDKYLTRRKDTVAPFIDIDSELLGKSVEYLKQHLNKESFEDEEIKKLANTESFASIYGTLLLNKKDIKLNGNEGIWIKYKYKSEEDAKRLYESLQGYNTGWCTANSLATAIDQVCGDNSYPGGDFYVYYSKNENNEYKIPRIAIRMENDSIGEVRGIAKNQNIESDMVVIVQEKLKEFSDGQKYQKKVSDMEKLTNIYKKYKTTELTLEELKFLYEIDYKIEGFGYGMDPRIREIIARRNHIQDLNKIFSYITAVAGDLNLDFLTTAKGLKFPKVIGGTLNLSRLTNAEGLELPETINGDLDLSGLETAEGLKLSKTIGGTLNLSRLTSAEGLEMPEIIGGSLDLTNLKSAESLELPETIGGSLALYAIKSAKGLKSPRNIGGSLILFSLTSAEGLKLPETIGGDLYLSSLTSAKGLELPETIGGSLNLDVLVSVEGLKFPISVNSLSLKVLSLKDLVNIDNDFKFEYIFLKDGKYSFEEFKKLLNIEREKLGLLNKKEELNNLIETNTEGFKRGFASIYLIVPFIVLLGIAIAFIILKS